MLTRGVTASLLLFLSFAACAKQTEDGKSADAQTKRLSPSTFSELPSVVTRALQARGCLIPQAFDRAAPHNVIRGEFARKGQTDWAILCSINRVSYILVFWGGSATHVSEVARRPDASYLQEVGEGKIGFSRLITAAGKDFIRAHQQGADPRLPAIDHHGIEDAFVGKASVIRYFYRGAWLELSGAD